MCIKILRTSYTKNEWFIIIFMGLLAIISTLFHTSFRIDAGYRNDIGC